MTVRLQRPDTTDTYEPRHLRRGSYVVLCPDRAIRHPAPFPTLAAADDRAETCCHGRHRVIPASAWPACPVGAVGRPSSPQTPTTAIARVPAG